MPIPSPYARILAWCERRPRRAERLARQLLAAAPPASSAQAWAELTLGWTLLAPQDLAAALAALQAAHSHFVATNDPVGAVLAEHGMLMVAFLRGAPTTQQAAWLELIPQLEAHGLDQAAAQAKVTRLRHLNQLGRSHEVVDVALALEPILAATTDHMNQALLARTLGIAQLQVGALHEASLSLERANLGFAQARAPIERAKTWFEQARVAHAQGRFQFALQRYEQARAEFKRINLELWIAFCDKAIGFSAIRLGRTDYAITTQLRARTRFEDLKMPIHVADCDLNLGNVANESGLNELALAGWRRAEQRYITMDAPGRTLITQRNQTEVLTRMGRYADAINLAVTLLPTAKQLALRLDQAELHMSLADTLLVFLAAPGEALPARVWEALLTSLPQSTEEDPIPIAASTSQAKPPDRATIITIILGHVGVAEQIFAAQPNPAGVARTHLSQGEAYLALGAYEQATILFTQAKANLPATLPYHWRAHYGLARCYEATGQLDAAMAAYRMACSVVAQLRQHLAVAHAASALLHEVRALMDAALRLAASRHDARGLLELAEQQRALALQQQLAREPIPIPLALQEEYERRRSELRTLALDGGDPSTLDAALNAYIEILLHGRHADPATDLPLSSQPLGLADQADIPPDRADLTTWRRELNARFGMGWTALIYVQAADQLLVLTLTPSSLQFDPVGPHPKLRNLIERACLPRYRRFTYLDLPFQQGQHSTPWADLATLGEILIPSAVRTRLAPDQRLVIVPGGALHSLPWAALRLADRWLIEQAIIQLVPSLSAWSELVRRPRAGAAALLIGIQDFGSRAAALPNALASLDLVAAHWPGPITRMEHGAASRAALRSAAAAGALRQYGLIHLATHGHLLSGRGILAHLKLADDDLLTDELAALDLGGALVVLAACEGALGEILSGDEVVSLSWALLAGGARDVIASLWQLYDAVLLRFLEPLYAALATGHDPPTALALAQRACLNHPEATLRLPFVWASLNALGAGE
ncbi:MAG: CHAT domain-containing protein [Oscillochloridaceae bacterium umkhey_bin13]